MHPLISEELARHRRHELLAAAARTRLMRDLRGTPERAALPWWRRLLHRLRREPVTQSPPTPVPARWDMAERVAVDGPSRNETEVARLCREATARGASPLLVSILADRQEADIVRQRAFGRLMTELDGHRRAGFSDTHRRRAS